MSYLQFVVETHEEAIPLKLKGRVAEEYRQEGEIASYLEKKYKNDLPRRGRPVNARSYYHPNHPKHKAARRIVRTLGHNMLPAIVGPFFPPNNDLKKRDIYCIAILSTLKPWRDVKTLKNGYETWEQAYQTFLNGCSRWARNVISGIHYFYDSQKLAESRRRMDQSRNITIQDDDDELQQSIVEDHSTLSIVRCPDLLNIV